MLPSTSPKHIVRQAMPIEEPVLLGGELVSDAIALWFALRRANDGIIPDWGKFRPFDNPRMLPFVSVAKAEANDYRCILVGEELRELLSIKLEGELLSKAMPSVNGSDVARRLDRALSDQLPNYVEKTMGWDQRKSFISYGALHLPFLSKRDGCPRILTVVDFEIG